MIEIKLSQGAKPGHGGVLPGAKVTAEIADARGVPIGVDCISPARHSAFKTPVEMMHFIAQIARPVRRQAGRLQALHRSCLGVHGDLQSHAGDRHPAGLHRDRRLGGRHRRRPARIRRSRRHAVARGPGASAQLPGGSGLRQSIRLGASGRVVTGFDIARLLALGADWCNAARGFMFALGCIQAQTCHTDRCPTGVSTQNPWRQRALVVGDKATRVHQFHRSTLAALGELVGASRPRSPERAAADAHPQANFAERGEKLRRGLHLPGTPRAAGRHVQRTMRSNGRWRTRTDLRRCRICSRRPDIAADAAHQRHVRKCFDSLRPCAW